MQSRSCQRSHQALYRKFRAVVAGMSGVVILAGVLTGVSAQTVQAAVPPTFNINLVYQTGSQISVVMDRTWVDNTAPAVSPAITNYEYTTNNGVTWKAFDPPVTTPVPAGSGTDQVPALSICVDSATGQPFTPGTTYDVALRAVNSDGAGVSSSSNAILFDSFDFTELNKCGGMWGGQDLKVMTGGTIASGDSAFNRFGVVRGGLDQTYEPVRSPSITRSPGDYCFYLFAEGTVIGCAEGGQFFDGFRLATGVSAMDWTTVDPPVLTEAGNTWTVDQAAEAVVNGRTYRLQTEVRYAKPNGFADVHHTLTTPDVGSLQKIENGTAANADDTVAVASVTGLMVGMCVDGTGIASGTVVKALDAATNEVGLDQVTTAALAGTPLTFTACAKIYLSSDMYLNGSDDGPGDSTVVAGNRIVAQVTDPSEINPSVGRFGGVGGIREVTGYPFSSWFEGDYFCVFGGTDGAVCPGSPWGVNYGGSWPNTVDSTPTTDAGVAAEWSVNPTGASGTHEVRTQLFFAAASPSISGTFDTANVQAGQPVDLNIRVNNAPAWGWNSAQFDVRLPQGAVAGTPTTTCTSATVAIVGTALQFRNGSLSTSDLDCGVTVPLTFSTGGTYAVTSQNISSNTINLGSSGGTVQALAASVSGQVAVAAAPAPPAPPVPAGPPTSVSVVAGDASAVVSWSPPVSSGSFPVTTYRVTGQPGGQGCLVAAPALTCTVTGLTNEITYTFSVAALTGAGWSPPAHSNPVTPGVIVSPWIVLDEGTRKALGRHDRIRTGGDTGGFEAGTRLTPWIRYSDQDEFRQGRATIRVQSDGSFTWTRKIRANRGLTAYVSYTDTESNRVFWRKVR